MYKSRLVSRGFEQNNFGNFSQIHSPVARLPTLRMLLSVCINYNLLLEQLDVKNAFLNSGLNENVDMKIPEGLSISDSDRRQGLST